MLHVLILEQSSTVEALCSCDVVPWIWDGRSEVVWWVDSVRAKLQL